jgi:hypothetical protein
LPFKVRRGAKTLSWNIVPNPAQSKVFISIQSPSNATGLLSIVNTKGQLLFRQRLNLPHGASSYTPPIMEKLSPGIYIIQLETAGGKSSKKWIMQ